MGKQVGGLKLKKKRLKKKWSKDIDKWFRSLPTTASLPVSKHKWVKND